MVKLGQRGQDDLVHLAIKPPSRSTGGCAERKTRLTFSRTLSSPRKSASGSAGSQGRRSGKGEQSGGAQKQSPSSTRRALTPLRRQQGRGAVIENDHPARRNRSASAKHRPAGPVRRHPQNRCCAGSAGRFGPAESRFAAGPIYRALAERRPPCLPTDRDPCRDCGGPRRPCAPRLPVPLPTAGG